MAVPAMMSTPTPGSTLPGPGVMFQWTGHASIASYWLYVGTGGAGSSNIFSSSVTNTWRYVGGLPASGTVNVRLTSWVGRRVALPGLHLQRVAPATWRSKAVGEGRVLVADAEHLAGIGYSSENKSRTRRGKPRLFCLSAMECTGQGFPAMSLIKLRHSCRSVSDVCSWHFCLHDAAESCMAESCRSCKAVSQWAWGKAKCGSIHLFRAARAVVAAAIIGLSASSFAAAGTDLSAVTVAKFGRSRPHCGNACRRPTVAAFRSSWNSHRPRSPTPRVLRNASAADAAQTATIHQLQDQILGRVFAVRGGLDPALAASLNLKRMDFFALVRDRGGSEHAGPAGQRSGGPAHPRKTEWMHRC